MLFLTDSLRMDMLPRQETQVQAMPIHSSNVRDIISRHNGFMCCFRKESVAKKFIEETGLDATINGGRINVSSGDKLINVSINDEGELALWWINPLYFEEC